MIDPASLPKASVLVSTKDLENETLKAHAVNIGLVVYTWNNLHLTLLLLFRDLLFRHEPAETEENAPNRLDAAKAIWHSNRSDRGQRQLVRSLIQSNLNDEPHAQKELLWAISEIDRLAAARNDAIHVAVDIFGDWSNFPEIKDVIEPNYTLTGPSAARLREIDLNQLFAHTSTHTLTLERFIERLDFLLDPRLKSDFWPERPSPPETLQVLLGQKRA